MEEENVPVMASMALTVTGEFLLIMGALFLLWGISDFITGFIGIEGSGKSIVGLVLIILSFVMLMRSRKALPEIKLEKQEMPKSGDYR